MNSLDEIEQAKAILKNNGYSVSAKPVDWRTLGCVVELKVQARDITEKEFVNAIRAAVDKMYVSKKALETQIGAEIYQMSAMQFKQLSRVRAKTQ